MRSSSVFVSKVTASLKVGASLIGKSVKHDTRTSPVSSLKRSGIKSNSFVPSMYRVVVAALKIIQGSDIV